jgi:hypothetical protein
MSRRASATVLGLLLVSLITGLSSIAGATGSNAGPASSPPAQPPAAQSGSNNGTVTPPTTTPPTTAPTTPPTTPTQPPASGSNAGGNGGRPGEQGKPPTSTPDPAPSPSPGAGGGNDLGPAVAAPATADDAPAQAGPAAAGSAAAGPGAPPADPGADAVAVAPAPTDDAALSLPDFVVGTIDDTATPRTAAESLVARAPQSIAAVAALILAIIVFLAFHRRPDRHDPRLAAANGVQDVARFR